MPFYKNIKELIQVNMDNGFYFFSKKAMNLYDRKVESELLAHLFITSEATDDDTTGTRTYSLRKADLDDGRISTVARFCTLEEAKKLFDKRKLGENGSFLFPELEDPEFESRLGNASSETFPPGDSLSTAVAKWLDQADESGKALVLEALQIRVMATRDEARISGVLPTQLPEAIGDELASDHLDFREQPGLPFDRAIHLAS